MRNKPKKLRQTFPSSNKSEALLDIVVPIFDQLDLAKEAVASIKDIGPGIPRRLVLVDNGSADPAVKTWMNEFSPPTKLVFLKENQGYAGGVNAGANVCQSPLMMILTTDVILNPGAVEAMIKIMDDPSVGVVGPMLLFPKGAKHGPPERVQHAGIAFNMSGKPFHIFMGWTPTNPKVSKQRDMQAVTGACLITRRDLFRKLGGMNEIYGRGTFEDIEYCFLVRAENRRVVFEPSAVGYHHVGASAMAIGGFPIKRNESIFRANVGQFVEWDEWKWF